MGPFFCRGGRIRPPESGARTNAQTSPLKPKAGLNGAPSGFNVAPGCRDDLWRCVSGPRTNARTSPLKPKAGLNGAPSGFNVAPGCRDDLRRCVSGPPDECANVPTQAKSGLEWGTLGV